MNVAFVPVYLNYMGAEAFGLVGIYVSLQAWFALLDIGMAPTIGREMARFTAGAYSAQAVRDLFRTMELLYFCLAALLACGFALVAPWVASDWLRRETLPAALVADVLVIIGCVAALRWLTGLYRSGITGLQQQVWLNVAGSVFATVRGFGVVAVLVWVSPSVYAFFLYQGLITVIEALALAMKTRRLLPQARHAPAFRWSVLKDIWKYSAGIAAITLLSFLLGQADKLLLSKLLTLTDFGYYTLAGTLAGTLFMLSGPVVTATFPRFTELATKKATGDLAALYHSAAQAVSLAVLPAGAVLVFFAEHLLLLWTGNAHTAHEVSRLLSVIGVGAVLNALMAVPGNMLLSHGHTRPIVLVNAAAVTILLPAIYWGATAYGAIAAAWVWVALNAGYVFIEVPIIHRIVLPTEKWRWYRNDVLIPATAAVAAAGIIRYYAPPAADATALQNLITIAAAATAALTAAIVVTPLGRATCRRAICRFRTSA